MFCGSEAIWMKAHAASGFLLWAPIANAQPPSVEVAPGAWPVCVGTGAIPACFRPAFQGAALDGSTQTVGYQLEPIAMASLPSLKSSGGRPTESGRNSSDVGAPRPSEKTVL